MPTSPLLGITELTPNQSGKEITINTAIEALESATNGSLDVDVSAGNVTLSVSQFTSKFLFRATGAAAAARIINLPAQVNGTNVKRIFGVRNACGQSLTVQVTGAPGTVVVIANGDSRLVDVDGAGNVKVVSLPPKFINIADAPSSYVGAGKYILRVKATEDGVEFRAPRLSDLTTDVDTTSTPPTDGQTLIWSAAQSKFVPGSIATSGGGGSGGGTGSGVASMALKPATGYSAWFPTLGNAPTVTEIAGKGLYITGAPVAGPQLRYALKPLPAADTQITCMVRGSMLGNFNAMGIIIRDATANKSLALQMEYNNANGYVEYQRFSSDTARASLVAGPTSSNGMNFGWLRLSYTFATKTVSAYYSQDGQTWFLIASADAYLTAPSHMGIVYTSWSSAITGGGFVSYWDDGVQTFDFDPATVPAMNIGTVSLSYRMAFGFEDNIASANYNIGRHTCVETFTIPANFAGSVASIATNPLATMTITLKKGTTTIGTVTVSTTGVITFASTGGTSITCNIGDVITASVGAADANASGFAMTLKA